MINNKEEILERDPPPGIICYPVDDSLMHFCARIKGPKDTPYEEGIFKVDVVIPPRYPLEPPRMQFLTPIYHPNIDDVGRICLDILTMPPKGSWKPSLNISTTLTSLSILMADPNPDDPLIPEIAREFMEDRPLFNKKARQETSRHAIEDNNSNLSLSSPTTIAINEKNSNKSLTEDNKSISNIQNNIDNESSSSNIENVLSNDEVQLEISCNNKQIEEKSSFIINPETNEDIKTTTNNELLSIIPSKRPKKKNLSLSRTKVGKRTPLGDISNQTTKNSITCESAPINSNIIVTNVESSSDHDIDNNDSVNNRRSVDDIVKTPLANQQ
ncbi:14005_t:CDS:2 [Entrophospora sp. SA101]|nr:14005_t:CDS:2 [Entrophospora sp. SA101]